MTGWAPRWARMSVDPLRVALYVLGTLKPEWVFLRYARLARRQGFARAYFILSLDCDTDADTAVAESVHARLAQLGIRPVYAVPGEVLERGQDVYLRIAASGAEFLNHGYRTHTLYDPQTRSYESILFYHQLPHAGILDDIRRGHDAHLRVLRKAPAGFRTPHFGTFQRPHQLRLLHQALAGMGYAYSSSTLPRYALLHGPTPRVTPCLYEIALSGCYDQPLRILDSWGFRFAPGRPSPESEYRRQLERMVAFFACGRVPGLLNYYADPSQVHDWPDFFHAMSLAAPFAARSYSHLVAEIQR